MVVELEHVPNLERDRRAPGGVRLGEPPARPVLVDDHALSSAQVLEAPLDHRRRPADQGRVVEPEQVDRLEPPVGQPRLEQSLVEGHRPINPLHATHRVELRVLHRLDVVDVLDLPVHHPDLRVARIRDGAEGAEHDAREDGHLLGDEQGGEGDAEDDA